MISLFSGELPSRSDFPRGASRARDGRLHRSRPRDERMRRKRLTGMQVPESEE